MGRLSTPECTYLPTYFMMHGKKSITTERHRNYPLGTRTGTMGTKGPSQTDCPSWIR